MKELISTQEKRETKKAKPSTPKKDSFFDNKDVIGENGKPKNEQKEKPRTTNSKLILNGKDIAVIDYDKIPDNPEGDFFKQENTLFTLSENNYSPENEFTTHLVGTNFGVLDDFSKMAEGQTFDMSYKGTNIAYIITEMEIFSQEQIANTFNEGLVGGLPYQGGLTIQITYPNVGKELLVLALPIGQ